MTELINLQNLALPTSIVLATAYMAVHGEGEGAVFLFMGGMFAHGILRGLECAISSYLIKMRYNHPID